jgi:DNA ligase (NAD+)
MDKRELYDKAKEAYYNGEPIMTDLEFDELEKELGLENQGYIGTHHQKSYTVKHPFIMGSLSKVQIKEDDNHNVDWLGFQEKVMTYLRKSNGYLKPGWFYEVTPKYDGCSFEAVIDPKGKLVSVSTRGDGDYGKDIKVWFENEWKTNYEPYVMDYYRSALDEQSYFFLKYLVIRGECLVKKSVFMDKYSDEFTMPRSFVAGVLCQDWEDTDKQKEMRDDLSWVAYDFREVYENGTIIELGYTKYDELSKHTLGNRPDFIITGGSYNFNINHLYGIFEKVRQNSEFALDGFVVKPGANFRLQDGGRTRQEDCVAIKYLPEIVDATLIDVEWNVGKTGEYYPTGILADVILGGKNVNRVSLSNYGKIIEDKIGIGSHLKISLAGDIIPFVYQVVSGGTPVTLPEDSYIDGVHLMKTMSEEDKMYIRFINSVNVLKPDGIGEKVATKLFEIMPTGNILDFMINDKWKESLDDSKSSQNIINSLNERKKTLSMTNLIQSMGYENCGEKNSAWLADKLCGLNPDTKGIPTTIIELSENYEFNSKVTNYMLAMDVKPVKKEDTSGKTPVILTGSPKECGYNTKADFLAKHPQFVETTKWNEVKILFTDDLESTSSKMEKAKKLGIEIKRYI